MLQDCCCTLHPCCSIDVELGEARYDLDVPYRAVVSTASQAEGAGCVDYLLHCFCGLQWGWYQYTVVVVVLSCKCRNIHDITLSYTFFKVDQDEEEAAAAAADDGSSGVKLHGPGLLPGGAAAPALPQAIAAAAAAAKAAQLQQAGAAAASPAAASAAMPAAAKAGG
jgi:hypothetical protein